MGFTLHHLPATGYRRSRWKNGGGWTTEIAISPRGAGIADDFAWRISIADIESDGPFSRFSGIDRQLLLLAGNGMTMTIAGRDQRLDRPLQAIRFDGDEVVDCRLLDGPTRDFNVMTRIATTTAAVSIVTRRNVITIVSKPGEQWLLHVVDGDAMIDGSGDGLHIGTGDSLLLEGKALGSSFNADCNGTIILVHFSSAA